jgi:hypothetical protein
MLFEKASKLLAGGFPIRHEHYGTLYSTFDKESLFIKTGSSKCVRVTVPNLEHNFWVHQPKNYVEEYNLLSSLQPFLLTDDWEVIT